MWILILLSFTTTQLTTWQVVTKVVWLFIYEPNIFLLKLEDMVDKVINNQVSVILVPH